MDNNNSMARGSKGTRSCCAPPEVPHLRRHFPSVSEQRLLWRPKYLLFAERLQAHGKRRKNPEKC